MDEPKKIELTDEAGSESKPVSDDTLTSTPPILNDVSPAKVAPADDPKPVSTPINITTDDGDEKPDLPSEVEPKPAANEPVTVASAGSDSTSDPATTDAPSDPKPAPSLEDISLSPEPSEPSVPADNPPASEAPASTSLASDPTIETASDNNPAAAEATPATADTPSAPADQPHPAAAKVPGNRRVLIIIVAVIIALALIAVAVMAFMSTGKQSNTAANANKTSQAAQTPAASTTKASASDVDQANQSIDTALKKVDDTKDYSSTDLANSSLGL